VAFFDRRKGYGPHTVDRRRTYVDIVERVLGTEMLTARPRQPRRFTRGFRIAGATVGSAAAAVEVRVLDNSRDEF
jgi:hypothetical protein